MALITPDAAVERDEPVARVKPPTHCTKCGATMTFERETFTAACARWRTNGTCACTKGDDECGCTWPSRPSYTPKTPTPVIPREERVTFTSVNRPVANGPYTEQRGNVLTRKIPPNGRVMLCRAPCAEHVHDAGSKADGTWVVRLEPAYRLREAADAECLLGDTPFTDEEHARAAFEQASEWLRGMEAPPEPSPRDMIAKALKGADAIGDFGIIARKILAGK